jgi:pimeloyl-ACP methyl ester carboxylesterase
LWHYRQTGAGRPLILLHGIGMSHAAWSAVTPHLQSRHVTAFDIAGFGGSPPLPDGTLPTIANLVRELERCIEDIGVRVPVDIAGNSLGGTMALEAARRGIARTVVAISPAGLWAKHDAVHVEPLFRVLRFMAVNFPRRHERRGPPVVVERAGARGSHLPRKPANADERRAASSG